MLGDSGPQVRLLQERLNQIAQREGSIPEVTVDGVFGRGTQEAVRALQRQLGIDATGAVGPVLWAQIITQGQGYA